MNWLGYEKSCKSQWHCRESARLGPGFLVIYQVITGVSGGYDMDRKFQTSRCPAYHNQGPTRIRRYDLPVKSPTDRWGLPDWRV